MNRTLFPLLAAATLLGAAVPCPVLAQSTDGSKPVAVIAMASYDELVKDVGAVGKLMERPELGNALDGMVAAVTQGKGLAGFDKSRPLGLIVRWSGQKPSGYGFVPVTDLKDLLGVLELYAKVEPGDGGLYKVAAKGKNKPLYVKGNGRWAFLADKPEELADVVADPSSLLGGLDEQYLLSARVFVANLPENVREKTIADITKNVQKGMQQKPGESDAVYDARKKLGQEVIDTFTEVLGDLDRVTLGWALNRETDKTLLDLTVTARPGSKLASQLTVQKIASNFRGFRMPEAALCGSWAAMLPSTKIEVLSTLIDAARGQALQDIEKKNAAASESLKPIVNDLADFLQETVKSGRCDGAVTVLMEPQGLTGLAGGYVADGALLDRAIHAVVDLVAQQQPAVREMVKFDAARLNDVRFHTVSIPLPPNAKDREKAVQLLGENIEVVVGIGPNSAYVAAGRDALVALKRAIEASANASSQTVLPVDVSLAVGSVARFIATVGKPHERQVAEVVAQQLQKTPGQDHVRLMGRSIPQGFQYRLEVEPGVVRLLGHMVVLGQKRRG